MKTFVFIAALWLLIGCRKPDDIDPVERTCYLSGQAAKTAPEVRQKLAGVWRLTGIVGSYKLQNRNPNTVADVTLTFQSDGQLVVTIDGKAQTPTTYDVIVSPLPYDSATTGPQLILPGRLAYAGTRSFELDRSTIYVCDDQLSLDYGTVVDASAQEYDRVR